MKNIMREFVWPIAWLILGLFIFIAALYFSSVPSNARPTCNPYNIQASGGGGAFGGYGEFCDEFPVESGQHFHCEYGGFIGYGGGCSWRWADNTIAPPPASR
jgi:hypothetical protein